MASTCSKVEIDIAEMAEYWGRRKIGWLDRACEEFASCVEPLAYYVEDVTLREIQFTNMCFTEWFLFERPLRDGKTPLQVYLEREPGTASKKALARLRQVEETQFFSRFKILGKDRAAGIAKLKDVRTDATYDVLDTCLCETGRWKSGVIAERIACVDDQWQMVGQVHLYDIALPEDTAVDGPGEVHDEDEGRLPVTAEMSFFLRLLYDCIGIRGRYSDTMRIRRLASGM